MPEKLFLISLNRTNYTNHTINSSEQRKDLDSVSERTNCGSLFSHTVNGSHLYSIYMHFTVSPHIHPIMHTFIHRRLWQPCKVTTNTPKDTSVEPGDRTSNLLVAGSAPSGCWLAQEVRAGCRSYLLGYCRPPPTQSHANKQLRNRDRQPTACHS